MIVSINPDEDPGQPGTTADPFIQERDLNVKVCEAVHAANGRCGITSRFNPAETLGEFIARVNSDGTELALGIGHNAGGGDYACTILCPGGDGNGNQLNAANAIAAAVSNALGIGANLLHEQLGVCCETNMDGVFVEPLFMDSPANQALYHPDVDAYAHKAGEAIVQGICAAYHINYVPPVAPPPPTPTPTPEWRAYFVAGPGSVALNPGATVGVTDLLNPPNTVGSVSGTFTWAGETTVNGVKYYVTQYALDNNQAHGLRVDDVKAASTPPTPTPTPDDDSKYALASDLAKLTAWAKDLGFKG